MLRTFRHWGEGLVRLNVLGTGAYCAAIGAAAFIGVLVCIGTGDHDRLSGFLIALAWVGGVVGLAWWVCGDARRSLQVLRQRHERERSLKGAEQPGDGETSGVVPQTPPWMG
jgi:hypothetical protein